MSYAPSEHYDRVTAAWRLLLGEELHYGVFDGDVPLDRATSALTDLMIEHAALTPGLRVLDVGCGTGAPACRLVREHDVVVTGITTSEEGVRVARERARLEGLGPAATFDVRDGMDNGFPDAAFDRVWALESSHLMRRRDRLLAECARVLRPGGRLVLCDIVRRRELTLADVRGLREPLALLRAVFGDARMEPPEEYVRLAAAVGLRDATVVDLTAATRPTFAAWRANADRHRDAVVALIGHQGWDEFRRSCDVLERFWDDGTLGYALVSATRDAD